MRKSTTHDFVCEIHVLGMDRRRIYCRVQWSKSQALKRLIGRVMASKLDTGHPPLRLQIFEKQSVLYILLKRSVFPYTIRITPRGFLR